MKKKPVIVLLLLTFQILCNAQYTDLRFEQLATRDGLPNRLRCMCRDYKGYYWFGGPDNVGLYKYDGYRTIRYQSNKNQPKSLSNDNVKCIFEDSKKQLWFCTNNGLNLLKRETETFEVFRNDPDNINSLSNDTTYEMLEDKKGNLWIVTGLGLNKWNPLKNNFNRYLIQPLNNHPPDNQMISVALDSKDNLWILTPRPGIYRFESGSGNFIRYDDPFIKTEVDNAKRLFIDDQDKLWICTGNRGLLSFDPATLQFTQYTSNGDGKGTNGHRITSIIQEDARHLLIAVDQGGLNRYDKETLTFEYITYGENNKEGLNNNGVWKIYKDNEGILWVLTSGGGINYHNPKKHNFKLFRHIVNDPNSISYDVVGCFCEDRQDLIWIGTDGGGLDVYNPKTNSFKNFKHNPSDPFSISGNTIRCIAEDKNKDLWIGTWDSGLNRYDRKSGRFVRYMPDKSNSTSISGTTVWHSCFDHKGILWLGIHNIGVDLFDMKKGVIKRFRPNKNDHQSLSNDKVLFIYEDRKQNIWLCTDDGLNLYDTIQHSFKVFRHFPSNSIRVIAQDRYENLWVGTAKGVCSIKTDGTIIDTYDETNGLAGNIVHGIVCDKQGNLWISTNNGISRFNPETKAFKNYTQNDGLQDNLFFQESFLITSNNEIYFGGFKGFNSFNPDSIKKNMTIPPVYIDEFQIFNKPSDYGTPGSPLQKAITETEEITLTHTQTVFLFGFTAISLTSPEKNNYAYRMEGFEKDWNYTDASRRYVTYTNLNPGKYTFRVIASNNDDVWNEEGASLRIIILPPWWKTWWFIAILTIFIAGVLLSIYYLRLAFYRKQKERLKVLVKERTFQLEELASSLKERQEEINSQKEEITAQRDALEGSNKALLHQQEKLLEQQRQILEQNVELDKHRNQLEGLVEERTKELIQAKEKAEESDRLKSSFLANLSHEIRTPLNAILGFSSLLGEKETTEEERTEYNVIIQNNSNALLDLINDILDLSRIEAGQMEVFLQETFLDEIVYDLIEVFDMLLKRRGEESHKHIVLNVNISEHLRKSHIITDKLRVRQILSNLIGNAIKFTNEGYIEVGCNILSNDKMIEFYVKDTGIGIKEEFLQVIFERFRKLEDDKTQLYRGTGLGLPISLQLVHMLGGEMRISSKEGEGSTLYFTIPLIMPAEKRILVQENKKIDQLPNFKEYCILVAEDDTTNFLFIEKLLHKAQAEVIRAVNGKQVLDILQNHQNIHLILMDIKMPEMDGLEALRKLKMMKINIPVIAQTAYALGNEVVKLKKEGFDEYITKPINPVDFFQKIASVLKSD